MNRAARPLTAFRELKVVDLASGLPAAMIAKFLRELGASVVRPENASDAFFRRLYPAYEAWRHGCPGCDAGVLDDLLADADVCLVGGESHPTQERRDARDLADRCPGLVVLDLTGYSRRGEEDRPATDILVQARTGALWEQFSERPIYTGFPLAGYGAVLQGLIGALLGLIDRERTGEGQVVRVSLEAGVAMFMAPYWMDAERGDERFRAITPRDVRHLIFPCIDDRYVHMVAPGGTSRLMELLCARKPGVARGVPQPDATAPKTPANFFGEYDLILPFAQACAADEFLGLAREAGLPAEIVLRPGENWDDGQVGSNDIILTDDEGNGFVGNPISIARTSKAAETGGGRENIDRPLQGLKVVDFGTYVAGPYASKILSDYGADVISVETADSRGTLSGERTIISAYHGKRSVCADLKSAYGREIVAALFRNADVVLNNFRPGVSARLGVGPDALASINAGAISLETTAYGGEGPKAGLHGFDMVIQANCGHEYRAGGAGNAPLCTRSPIVDFATGAIGAIAVLAAHYQRLRNGEVATLQTSLLNGGLHMMSELVRRPDGTFEGGGATDSSRSGPRPSESIYQAKDGWIALAIRSPDMARSLERMLDIEILADPLCWGEAERKRIADSVRRRGLQELVSACERAGIWVEPCARDAWKDRRGDNPIHHELEDEKYGLVHHCLGPLVELARGAGHSASQLTPVVGADTVDVLRESGVADDRLREWMRTGVVTQTIP